MAAGGAGPGPGLELCPHCHRAFRRLRAHLPHCRARPGAAAGAGERAGTGKSAGTAAGKSAGVATGTGQSSGTATGTATGTGQSAGTAPGTGQSSGTAPGTATGTGQSSGTATGAAPRTRKSSGAAAALGTGKRPGTTAGKRLGSAPETGPGTGTATGKRAGSGSALGSVSGTRPGPAPGSAPEKRAGSAPGSGSAPGTEKRAGSAAGTIPGPGGSSAGAPGGTERKVEPAVRDVARALDLRPEEVEGVPQKLEHGVKVVIQKHRARVVREKQPRNPAGVPGVEGTDPGRAASPQRGKTAPKSTHTDTRSLGAVGNVPGSKKSSKSSSKATKVLQEPLECRNSPGDPVPQEGTGKAVAEEEQEQLEVGVGYKAPLSALHPKKLQLSVTEGFGAHSEGTSQSGLSSLETLRDSREQVAGVSQPVLGTGTRPELALHHSWLHSPQIQPACSSQASGRSPWVGATGLEWFPDLYPDYVGLRIFPGKRLQEGGITVETPRDSFSEGRRGPLWERPLLEVRLGELHTWISTWEFSPQGLLGVAQKAWNSYYAKYINVRKGGPAGISMLLAGCCLLSYSWNYQYFRRHRWRKYH